MSLLKALGLVRGPAPCVEPDIEPARACAEEGRAVFQEAELVLEEFHRMRVVITHVSGARARVAYAARTELPFRVRLIAPGLKLKCWARVAAQDDAAAELEFEHATPASGSASSAQPPHNSA